MSLNKIMLIGRLAAKPTIKQFDSGAVCNFDIAVNEKWFDKNSGEKKEKTEWLKIAAWGKIAEICEKYLDKGRQVYVEGKLQTRTWDKEDGTKGYMTEVLANNVQFLGGATDGVADKSQSAESTYQRPAGVKNYAEGIGNVTDMDEEIGF